MMPDILKTVINEGGQWCNGCSMPDFRIWRVLHGREVEQCANCGDEAYDVYDFAENQQQAVAAYKRYLQQRDISEWEHQQEIGEWLDVQD